jgi:hypothetical protein
MSSPYIFSCQHGYSVESNGVHTRVVLCGKPAKLYYVPGSVHELALCNEHVKLYEGAEPVEIVPPVL